MRKLFITATILAAMTITTFAQEKSNQFAGAYIGAMGGYNSYRFDFLEENVGGLTFGGLLGYRVAVSKNVLVGLEGFVNSNEAKESLLVSDIIIKVDSDASYGVGATLGVAGDYIMSFVMIGYGWNDVSISMLDISERDTDDGLHIAVGAEFQLTEFFNLRVQGDWQDFDQAHVIGATAGIIFRF